MNNQWLAFARAAGETLNDRNASLAPLRDLGRALLAGVKAAEAAQADCGGVEGLPASGDGGPGNAPPASPQSPPSLPPKPSWLTRGSHTFREVATDYLAPHDALRVALEDNARLRAAAEAVETDECGNCGERVPPGCGGEFAKDEECAMRSAVRQAEPVRWRVERLSGSGVTRLCFSDKYAVSIDRTLADALLAGRDSVTLRIEVEDE